MICFPDADAAGHSYGWISPQYLRAVQNIDGYLAMVLASVEAAGLGDKVHILLTADHGGEGYNHHEDLPVNRTIPFLIVGPSVKPGTAVAGSSRISITDFAPTAAKLLGIELPRATAGRCLTEAFETATAAVPPVRPTAAPPASVARRCRCPPPRGQRRARLVFFARTGWATVALFPGRRRGARRRPPRV